MAIASFAINDSEGFVLLATAAETRASGDSPSSALVITTGRVESLASGEARTSTLTFSSPYTDSSTTSEARSALAVFASSGSDSNSTGESRAGYLTIPSASTETFVSSDTRQSSLVALGSFSETTATSEDRQSYLSAVLSDSQTAIVQETPASLVNFQTYTAEAGQIGDAEQSYLLITDSIGDSSSPQENAEATPTYLGSAVDIAVLVETEDALLSMACQAADTPSPLDSISSIAYLDESLFDSTSAPDNTSSYAVFDSREQEQATVTESHQGLASFLDQSTEASQLIDSSGGVLSITTLYEDSSGLTDDGLGGQTFPVIGEDFESVTNIEQYQLTVEASAPEEMPIVDTASALAELVGASEEDAMVTEEESGYLSILPEVAESLRPSSLESGGVNISTSSQEEVLGQDFRGVLLTLGVSSTNSSQGTDAVGSTHFAMATAEDVVTPSTVDVVTGLFVSPASDVAITDDGGSIFAVFKPEVTELITTSEVESSLGVFISVSSDPVQIQDYLWVSAWLSFLASDTTPIADPTLVEKYIPFDSGEEAASSDYYLSGQVLSGFSDESSEALTDNGMALGFLLSSGNEPASTSSTAAYLIRNWKNSTLLAKKKLQVTDAKQSSIVSGSNTTFVVYS